MKRVFLTFLLVLAALLISQTSVLANLNDGLIAYYPFDGNANDESGKGNNGHEMSGSSASYVSGINGSAISLDGRSDTVIIPRTDDLIFNGKSLSVSVWARNTNTSTIAGTVFTNYWSASGSPNCVTLGFNNANDGEIVATLRDHPYTHNNTHENLSSGIKDIEGNWHHMVITYDVTTNARALYVDGVLTDGPHYLPVSDYDNGTDFRVGSNVWNGDPYFASVDVDELRIYSRALTETEVQELSTGQSVISPSEDPELPPEDPQLFIKVEMSGVTVSWEPVENAVGYTLFYAPYPAKTPITSKEMYEQTSLSVDLPMGAAYYVAVKAYNENGESGYSNIESFSIDREEDGLGINEIVLGGVDPFALFEARDFPGAEPGDLLRTYTRNFYYSLLMGTATDIVIPAITSVPTAFFQAWGTLPSMTLTCYSDPSSNYVLPVIIYRPPIYAPAANNLGSFRIDAEIDRSPYNFDSLIHTFETERSRFGLETIFSSDGLYAFALKAHYLYPDSDTAVAASESDPNFPNGLGIMIMSEEERTIEFELESNIFAEFYSVLEDTCHINVNANQ